MTRSLARRQFWIVVLLAAVAYLWWHSLEPGRYDELPSDPSGSYPVQILSSANPGAWAMPEGHYLGIVSTRLGRQLRMSFLRAGDTLIVDAQWRFGDTVVRHTRAALVEGYQPAWLTVAHETGDRRTVELHDSTVTVTDGSGDATRYPWVLGGEVLIEDLIFVQASRWRGVQDTGRALLVTFPDRGTPITPVDVSVWSENDSTVMIQTDHGDRLEFGYRDGVPPLRRYCDGTGECYEIYLVQSPAGER